MKATYNWIKEYVPEYDGDIRQMCDHFTMSGTEVEFFVELDGDYMIEFSVTSNRVDCLGIAGLARELAAASGKPFVPPHIEAAQDHRAADEVCSVAVEATEECPRYTALIIEDVKVGPSPDWMVKRLEAIGLRSLNNIVDATNYALFVTNQPFHAFDLDKLNDGKIIVRQAKAGETQVAINGKEYELDPSMTAICDTNGPVAIAGVMGGGPTEVTDGTTRILLETAYFEPIRIRKTSKKLNLSSDSSFRFERGIDAEGTLQAAEYCAALIAQVAGGSVRQGVVEVNHVEPRNDSIPFRHSEVKRIVGIDIPWETCNAIFASLDLKCGDSLSKDGSVAVSPPSYRRDVYREIDLVEEVIRIHGLESIPSGNSMPVMTVHEPKNQNIRKIVRDGFVAAGYQEVLTTSFCGVEDAEGCYFASTEPVTIANAMRKDESALRQSLMPSLLKVRKTNQDHGNDNVRLIEATVIYLAHSKDELPEHLPICAALMDGDFRELRGDVERVCASLGLSRLEFAQVDDGAKGLLEPSHAAMIKCDGKVLGYVGRPTAAILKRNDLKAAPLYLEMRLDVLTEMANLEPKYTPLSRFPAVHRDLAVVVDASTRWAEVMGVIESLELPNLEDLEFFDEYYGKPIEAGKKSLAFSLTYRSHERTLTGAEVDESQTKAIQALEEKLSAQIRS